MKSFSFKKSVLSVICILAIFAGIGVVYSAAKEGKGIIKFLNGSTPSITNGFIDKEKYFPGDIMAITVETKDAADVKALVENESGFNEVKLVVMASFEGKETWSGKWKVENSLTGKKYKLKIIAVNKSGAAETVLEWEDPNPGHPASQVESGTFDAGNFTFQNALDIKGDLHVFGDLEMQNLKSIKLGNVSRSTWPSSSWSGITDFPGACPAGQYVDKIGNPSTCSAPPSFTGCSYETKTTTLYASGMDIYYAPCPVGKTLTGGGCSIDCGEKGIFKNAPGMATYTNNWACGIDLINSGGSCKIMVHAICC